MFKKFAVFVFIVMFSLLYFGCENANLPTQQEIGGSDINLNLTALPAGAVLQSATFSIYANYVGQPGDPTPEVFIHRVTADWMESSVTWNNFGGSGSYDPAVIASFFPAAAGWQSEDITGLVAAWLDGTYPNYGILIRQDNDRSTGYFSSEYEGNPARRPILVIAYTLNGTPGDITIQRGFYGDVFDAQINQGKPDLNYGSLEALLTRKLFNLEKQSLLKFEVEEPPANPGTGTPGYWKNHPEAWPVDEITIGGVTYSKAVAIAYMEDPVKGDKLYTMFPALVSAKLNVLIGNDASCISDVISDADDWMAAYGPIGVNSVPASSAAWQEGEPLYWQLDDYNNGLLCAPERD